MNLKQLRISKGLTQEECAKIAGVSRRTYQTYEGITDYFENDKYNAIYNKIYTDCLCEDEINFYGRIQYKANVKTDDELKNYAGTAKNYKKRIIYKYLLDYINNDYPFRTCILYGLRRTGKTTLILQCINDLPIDKVAYLKVHEKMNMNDLRDDLDKLIHNGKKYIFIDEITLMPDFINTASIISDSYCYGETKIILSGTDSLGFYMANRVELFDRTYTIHTSFISFSEYCYLLDNKSIDGYIEYGGTLKKENMYFDDSDVENNAVSFRTDESTRKYIDSAISINIQNSLKNNHDGELFGDLYPLYKNDELTNVINRIVENMNHNFVIDVIQEKFKSHDFGSTKDLLKKNDNLRKVLENIDYEKLIDNLKRINHIKEYDELHNKINQFNIDRIKSFLKCLDLIYDCKEVSETSHNTDITIFVQPGIRYAVAKSLVYSLNKDSYFMSLDADVKEFISNKILEDVKGKMLEEIVLLETTKKCHNNIDVFKFKFSLGGEFDMVIVDRNNNQVSVYEIKHSDKVSPKQYQHLIDKEKLDIIEKKYGRITNKIVLYRGTNKVIDNDIKYQNIEEYLNNL